MSHTQTQVCGFGTRTLKGIWVKGQQGEAEQIHTQAEEGRAPKSNDSYIIIASSNQRNLDVCRFLSEKHERIPCVQKGSALN